MKGVVVELGGEVDEDDEEAFVVWSRCYGCGHRLAYAASACPQCNADFDDRQPPEPFPEDCECRRCVAARAGAPS